MWGEVGWENGHHHRGQHRYWEGDGQGPGEERYCSGHVWSPLASVSISVSATSTCLRPVFSPFVFFIFTHFQTHTHTFPPELSTSNEWVLIVIFKRGLRIRISFNPTCLAFQCAVWECALVGMSRSLYKHLHYPKTKTGGRGKREIRGNASWCTLSSRPIGRLVAVMEDRRGIRGTEGALWGSADRQQRAMGGCTRQCTHTHTHTGRHTHTNTVRVSNMKTASAYEIQFVHPYAADMPCMASTSAFLKKCICVTHVRKIQESYFSPNRFFFFCIKINMNTEEWRRVGETAREEWSLPGARNITVFLCFRRIHCQITVSPFSKWDYVITRWQPD